MLEILFKKYLLCNKNVRNSKAIFIQSRKIIDLYKCYLATGCDDQNSLRDKVVLITGGLNFIGKRCAEEVLKANAKGVMMADRDDIHGSRFVFEFSDKYGADRIAFIRMEPENATLVKHAFRCTKKFFNGLDIVINNFHFKPESKWQYQLDENLKGLVLSTKFAMENMGTEFGNKGGSIINITSEGYQMRTEFCPMFNAIQDFVMSYSHALAPCTFQQSKVKLLTICRATCESISCDLVTIIIKGKNGCVWMNVKKNKTIMKNC